jgi:hypothetical protein
MKGPCIKRGCSGVGCKDKCRCLICAGINEGVNGKKRVSILGAVEPARTLPSVRVCEVQKQRVGVGKTRKVWYRETEEVNS